MSNDDGHKILFQLTGSIACFKACDLISRLAKRGFAVQTVASAGALRFVGAATLEGLTGRPPFTDLYETGRTMDHIRLARWADLALLCPATANSLNRLAAGLADDAIGALFLAWEIGDKPYLVAPAMNATMWDHPATRAARERLAGFGARLVANAARHGEDVVRVERDGAVRQVEVQPARHHQEELVGLLVDVLRELVALDVRDLDVVVVHLGKDVRHPLLGDGVHDGVDVAWIHGCAILSMLGSAIRW